MPEPKRLELVYRGMVRKFPRIMRDRVLFPWVLTKEERRTEQEACRGEYLDVELLDRVLEARTLRSGVTRKPR